MILLVLFTAVIEADAASFEFLFLFKLCNQKVVFCSNEFFREAATPYSDVDRSLRSLAGAAEGFGSSAVGGVAGPLYHVTTLEDHGPGSLREACIQKQPLWIVFEVSGIINLTSPVRVMSHKTVDGRGSRIKITGWGLTLTGSDQVIINNLEFFGGRGDAITVINNSTNVWIDRCTLSDFHDGLIDVTRGSTEITISRCLFHHHQKTILIGASPKDLRTRNTRVTIHHCLFNETGERHPRVRFAKVHLYNNHFRRWGLYAVRASVEAQIVSEYNVYEAGPSSKIAFDYYPEKAPDHKGSVSGNVSSERDLFLHGAQGQSNSNIVFHPEEFYSKTWTCGPADEQLIESVNRLAGVWRDLARPPEEGY